MFVVSTTACHWWLGPAGTSTLLFLIVGAAMLWLLDCIKFQLYRLRLYLMDFFVLKLLSSSWVQQGLDGLIPLLECWDGTLCLDCLADVWWFLFVRHLWQEVYHRILGLWLWSLLHVGPQFVQARWWWWRSWVEIGLGLTPFSIVEVIWLMHWEGTQHSRWAVPLRCLTKRVLQTWSHENGCPRFFSTQSWWWGRLKNIQTRCTGYQFPLELRLLQGRFARSNTAWWR
jgi:hypothetical protein